MGERSMAVIEKPASPSSDEHLAVAIDRTIFCFGVGKPTRGAAMSLTAEQRRALAVLARVGLKGSSQTSLMAHGFCISMIAGLIKRGFAALTREKLRTGSRLIDVGSVRITAAGRDALTAEGCFTRFDGAPCVPEEEPYR
jgi:hypothetical protein